MSIQSKEIAIKADNGIVFNVVILEKGDKYGLNNVLVHDKDQPLVEFYDSTHKFTEHGQFVSRYYIDTIVNSNSGLNLHGGEPNWQIDSESMNIVRTFLKNSEAYINSPKLKKSFP